MCGSFLFISFFINWKLQWSGTVGGFNHKNTKKYSLFLGAFFDCVANLPCAGLSINEHSTKVVGLGLSYFESSLHCAIKTTQYTCGSLQHFLTHTYLYNSFYLTCISITFKLMPNAELISPFLRNNKPPWTFKKKKKKLNILQ